MRVQCAIRCITGAAVLAILVAAPVATAAEDRAAAGKIT